MMRKGWLRMTNAEAAQILLKLAQGADPLTGEALSEYNICCKPTVIRALYEALGDLMHDGEPGRPEALNEEPANMRPNRVNNGKCWTPDEDEYLRNAHQCGATYEQMANQLHRSPMLIKFRAVYLDLVSRDIFGYYPPVKPGYEHQALPWYPEEDALLAQMAKEHCGPEEMAKRLKRKPESIESRLKKRGLITSRYDVK